MLDDTGPRSQPEFEKGIRSLPLDSLTTDWITNVRADPGDVTELANSIEHHGLQHPIVVRESPANPNVYEIVEGSRRVAAYRELSKRDPIRYRKIEARLLRNCDDIAALEMSFDENDKRGNLSAKEVGAYIERMKKLSPHGDPESKSTKRWIAEQLKWGVTTRNKKGVLKFYPNPKRVDEAIKMAEFQRMVPQVEIKTRSQGDAYKSAVPMSVAKTAIEALYIARSKLPVHDQDANKKLEDFLLIYAQKTPPKLRKVFRERFAEEPTINPNELLDKIMDERSAVPHDQMVAFKATSELYGRIQDWWHSEGHDNWTISDAVRDLIERGLKDIKV